MRRPVWILHVFIVGLALHNLVMAELWNAGLRGGALTVISAWKEALLAVGLGLVVLEHRSLSLRLTRVDWLAAAYAAIAVIYALLPQHWLGGGATHRGELLALREDLLPVGCYALGRGLALTRADVRAPRQRRCLGLRSVSRRSASSTSTRSRCRGGGRARACAAGLPTSSASTTAVGSRGCRRTSSTTPVAGDAYRRLVSTFLSPLATSYLLVVALLAAAVWRLRLGASLRLWLPVTALISVALLLTHSRSSFIVLGLGLLVIAAVRLAWRWRLLAAVGAVAVAGVVFLHVYTDVAPVASTYTASRSSRSLSNKQASTSPGRSPRRPISPQDADTQEHLSTLRAGVRAVLDHPQGYGLGNAGSNAARTGVTVLAGEVDLHRDWRRRGARRRARLRGVVVCARLAARAAQRMARSGARRDARARRADRYRRRSLGRLRDLDVLAGAGEVAGGGSSELESAVRPRQRRSRRSPEFSRNGASVAHRRGERAWARRAPRPGALLALEQESPRRIAAPRGSTPGGSASGSLRFPCRAGQPLLQRGDRVRDGFLPAMPAAVGGDRYASVPQRRSSATAASGPPAHGRPGIRASRRSAACSDSVAR